MEPVVMSIQSVKQLIVGLKTEMKWVGANCLACGVV